MHSSLLLLGLAGLVSATQNHPDANAFNTSYHHFDCGTDKSSASSHFLSTIHSLHAADVLLHNSLGSPAAAAAAAVRRSTTSITIPLYLHVVTTAANKNMVTPAQLTAQYATLNTAYKPYGVQFALKNTTWTVNDAWAVGASTTSDTTLDTAMKTALRQGGYSSLNLYFQSDLAGGVLGKCTLPTNIGAGSSIPKSVYVSDGCNIALGTVPNGPILGYDKGMTAVHETGHWLGLLHTFEGYTCGGTGDYIADTPAESESTSGCPTSPWKNTCPGTRAGVDPIHNYMDYSTDVCYTRFTPLQQGRIHTLWTQYRAAHV